MSNTNYEPTNSDLQNQIAVNTNAMVNEINAFRRHMDQKFAPARRKKTNHTLTCNQTGELMLVQYYDNYTCDCFFIFTQSLGCFTVSKLKPVDFECKKDLFLIRFSHANIEIVGDIAKLSEKYFYELFLQQRISFNQQLSRTKVQRGLYEFFKGLIFSCENITNIPSLAGWYNQKFRHCENTITSPSLGIFPITQKKFEILSMDDSTFVIYKDFLMQFENTTTRLMIAIYPIASILASIFKEFRGNITFTLNLIPTSPLSISDVAEYFQIFSRDTLYAFHSSYSQKNIEKILQQAKDEVLLMDMRLPSNSDYYRIKQRNERFDFVSSVLSGRTNLSLQKGYSATAGLVTISDEIILKPNVYNIPTSWEFNALNIYGMHTINLFKENHIMAKIYSRFVRFVEQKGDDFFEIFTRTTDAQSSSGTILEITYHLFCDFWKIQNINLAKELEFPKEIDFDNILLSETDYEDEDVALFLDAIKENLNDYSIVKKHSSDAGESCIFYDNTYVYFPFKIMERICKNSGIKNYRKFFIKLRAQNMLSATHDRLTKHVVVNHITIGCYVLRRCLFDKIGELEFTFLGKDT